MTAQPTTVLTRVKICGLRHPQHARAAIDAGADLLGIVFAPSRRQASVDEGRAIRAEVGPRIEVVDSTPDAFAAARAAHGPLLVGVFAGQSPDEINRIALAVDLDIVQLSGGEHPSIAARIQRPVIRTVHIPPAQSAPGAQIEEAGALKGDAASPDPASAAKTALADAQREPPTVTHLDTKSAEGGGSGETFDWSIAALIAPQHPFLMAGGLDSDNVARAIAQVAPWGVDVSSGVETDGVKDPAKIQAFLFAARAAQKASSA